MTRQAGCPGRRSRPRRGPWWYQGAGLPVPSGAVGVPVLRCRWVEGYKGRGRQGLGMEV